MTLALVNDGIRIAYNSVKNVKISNTQPKMLMMSPAIAVLFLGLNTPMRLRMKPMGLSRPAVKSPKIEMIKPTRPMVFDSSSGRTTWPGSIAGCLLVIVGSHFPMECMSIAPFE